LIRLISKQVPLALKLDNEAIFDSFWSEADPIAVASVRDLSQGSAGWIYLAGSQGGGVSHLLQACSAEALKAGFSAMYVDFLALLEIFEKSVDDEAVADYFDSLENFDVLVIDNIDAVSGLRFWQEQLFYLLEKLKNKPNSCLLLGAHTLANDLDCDLLDLKSRLKWATGFQLRLLDDTQKIALLQFKANRLGLTLSLDVANFLLARCSRNLADLSALLSDLDVQALSSKRRLTIPWIKSILNI
jgi:DnaA family protein